MDMKELEAVIEGILFTMGDSVEAERLATALAEPIERIWEAVSLLEEKYKNAESGIRILRLEDSVQLSTKPELFEYLVRVAKTPKKQSITDTMLETLSIVAYKQPVTRMDIEKIRGVSSDHAVNKLVEYGLIEEVGRLDAPGRPMLFATTEQFLRCFGVNSISELPQIDEDTVQEIKLLAEAEVDGVDVETLKEYSGEAEEEELLLENEELASGKDFSANEAPDQDEEPLNVEI